MDTAKAANLYSTYPADFLTYVNAPIGKGAPVPGQLRPLICIPTTAGTGSEITPWATIWDMDEKKKYSLHLPNLFSEVAIYDPILTLSVPKDITIQTGLDTLSHALESIWNKNANPITIRYAIQSSKLIIDNFNLFVRYI